MNTFFQDGSIPSRWYSSDLLHLSLNVCQAVFFNFIISACFSIVITWQTYLDKGEELINEVTKVTEGQDHEEMVTMTSQLKSTSSQFSIDLESVKERIELTSKCYQLLDKVHCDQN